MSDPLAFLAGGGEAARLILARDWSDHPLGRPETWAPEFRAALSLVLNSPESMILAWGPDLHFFFNDTYVPLLGPRLSWAMGERFDRVWSDAWDQAKPIIDEAFAGRAKRFVDLPWRLDTDRGAAETWWTFSYSRVLDAEGAVAGLFIITNETTARVLGDAALREAQTRLNREAERQRLSMQQMPGFAALLSGPEHRFTYVNDAYVTIAGARDFLGRTVREVFPEIADQGFFELLDGAYATGEPFSARSMPIRLAGESTDRFIDLLYHPIRDDEGRVSGIFVGGYDVTGARQSADALVESEARYRTLFGALDEGFCIIEFLDGPHGPLSDYVHVEANAAYTRHAGIPDVVGRKVREMVPEEADGWVALYGEVLRTGEPIRFERELVATRRHLDIAAFRVEPASRRQVAVLFRDMTETVRTRERYRLAIEATQVGIFDYNLVTDELTWDARVRELFGVGPDAAIDYETTFLAGLHPDDRERADAAVRAAIDPTGPGYFDIEYRVRAHDTKVERWLAALGQAVIAQGRTIRFVGTVRDTTAARAAEDVLRATEERLRLATRATNDAIWDWDLKRDHVLWNDALEEAYGHAPASVVPVGTWWIARIHPDDRARIDASIHTAIASSDTTWTSEYRFERAGGTYADVLDRGFVIRDETGQAVRMIGAMLDLTERKRAETALRRLNEVLEQRVAEALSERNILADIVEGTDAFVQVVDPDFRIMAINGAAAREFELLFGALPKVGDDLLALLADRPEPQAAVRALWARALAGEDFVEVAAFGDPARRRRHYELRFGVLRDARGRQIGAYQFVYDVTERLAEQERLREMEEALRQSQKMEAVGQLTGGLAHDFNNLLAGITGSLELMNTRMSQGRLKDVDKYMVAAQGAAKRAAALTHRLLAFSRRQTLDPRPTDVNALIYGMEELIRRTVGPAIQIETVGASGLWPTLVDPPQLENALLNLCINARDAMPEGGRITIETANKWLDWPAARQHDVPEGQYLSLCVTDTGIGMSPDVVAKAFDPFFTTKPLGQGTGLGLSMIYGFAKQSGGQVRIYSEVGQGTTVCIYLPRYFGSVEPVDPLAQAAQRPRALQGETVLIVDDEPTVRMLVTEVLEELGYTAIEAADSVAGLKVLQSDVRIDLLVTDVGLPGGMNGRQMADAGRVSRPDLKVLFVTGYAENAAVGNGHLEPGMQVLTKPFSVDGLAERIRALVSG